MKGKKKRRGKGKRGKRKRERGKRRREGTGKNSLGGKRNGLRGRGFELWSKKRGDRRKNGLLVCRERQRRNRLLLLQIGMVLHHLQHQSLIPDLGHILNHRLHQDNIHQIKSPKESFVL